MQVSKTYTGNIVAIGTTTARQVSFGVTTTASNFQNRIDRIHECIAEFLHEECGVDAAYEVRDGSTYKFLWIYGVPFLFYNTSHYLNFFGPFNGTHITAGAANTSNQAYSLLYPADNVSTNYSFTLYFAGDPQKGFVLRLKGYNVNFISGGFWFAFAKAKNVVNGRDAVIWKYQPGSSGYAALYVNGIDLDESGKMIESSFSKDPITYFPTLLSKAINRNDNPGKLPLVPIMFGVWKTENMYQRPFGFNLPAPAQTNVEMQTTVEIAGRKFIVTCVESNTANSSYMNLGLLEVTE